MNDEVVFWQDKLASCVTLLVRSCHPNLLLLPVRNRLLEMPLRNRLDRRRISNVLDEVFKPHAEILPEYLRKFN